MIVKAYAATEAKGLLKPFEYELPEQLQYDEVELEVSHCGVCHSDLSMLNNDWGYTTYPFVPGHEVIGKISSLGEHVKHLKIGQVVGVGWYSRSCLHCEQCMSGNHNLCGEAQGIFIGRFGGFANKVRVQAAWVNPIPAGLDASKAGPLFCGGITVFNPIIQNGIKPLDRVGVVGIGGLGHMALGFLNAWGCEIAAFSSSKDKEKEARNLGAHHFINSGDENSFEKYKGFFDMILVTVNVPLNWEAYMSMLRGKGKLHFVGAAGDITTNAFSLIGGQKSVAGSPLGSPYYTHKMLEFAARHNILPITETYGITEINEAIEKLANGKPRYRLVLDINK